MKLAGDIVFDIGVGIVVDIEALGMMKPRVVEVVVEAVCYNLAAPRNAMVFDCTDSVDKIADKEAVERATEASDSRGAGIKQLDILDLLQRNLVSESWMDKAADSLVAGNDSPPWLTIML